MGTGAAPALLQTEYEFRCVNFAKHFATSRLKSYGTLVGLNTTAIGEAQNGTTRMESTSCHGTQ